MRRPVSHVDREQSWDLRMSDCATLILTEVDENVVDVVLKQDDSQSGVTTLFDNIVDERSPVEVGYTNDVEER